MSDIVGSSSLNNLFELKKVQSLERKVSVEHNDALTSLKFLNEQPKV